MAPVSLKSFLVFLVVSTLSLANFVTITCKNGRSDISFLLDTLSSIINSIDVEQEMRVTSKPKILDLVKWRLKKIMFYVSKPYLLYFCRY